MTRALLLTLILALSASPACDSGERAAPESTTSTPAPAPPPRPPDPDAPCKEHLAGTWRGGGVTARFSGSFVTLSGRGQYRRELVLYSGCELGEQVYIKAGGYAGRVLFRGDDTIRVEGRVLGALRSWTLYR